MEILINWWNSCKVMKPINFFLQKCPHCLSSFFHLSFLVNNLCKAAVFKVLGICWKWLTSTSLSFHSRYWKQNQQQPEQAHKVCFEDECVKLTFTQNQQKQGFSRGPAHSDPSSTNLFTILMLLRQKKKKIWRNLTAKVSLPLSRCSYLQC